MNAIAFLAVRATHVLLAGLWIGSTVFISAMLVPAVEAVGPSGGQVMKTITRRGLRLYMTTLGATTLATGLYLFWRFTGGFDASVSVTHAGVAFGTGGAAGILAGIIGGAVVGRNGQKVGALMDQAVGMADSPARGLLFQQAARLSRLMKTGSRVVIVLQAVALILMAIGHYV